MEITEELIREIVKEVVNRIEHLRSNTQLDTAASSVRFKQNVLTASDIEYYAREGIELIYLSKKTVITPLATERSRDLNVELIFDK